MAITTAALSPGSILTGGPGWARRRPRAAQLPRLPACESFPDATLLGEQPDTAARRLAALTSSSLPSRAPSAAARRLRRAQWCSSGPARARRCARAAVEFGERWRARAAATRAPAAHTRPRHPAATDAPPQRPCPLLPPPAPLRPRLQVAMCAPTGRAAQRLQEIVALPGLEASTIHRCAQGADGAGAGASAGLEGVSAAWCRGLHVHFIMPAMPPVIPPPRLLGYKGRHDKGAATGDDAAGAAALGGAPDGDASGYEDASADQVDDELDLGRACLYGKGVSCHASPARVACSTLACQFRQRPRAGSHQPRGRVEPASPGPPHRRRSARCLMTACCWTRRR